MLCVALGCNSSAKEKRLVHVWMQVLYSTKHKGFQMPGYWFQEGVSARLGCGFWDSSWRALTLWWWLLPDGLHQIPFYRASTQNTLPTLTPLQPWCAGQRENCRYKLTLPVNPEMATVLKAKSWHTQQRQEKVRALVRNNPDCWPGQTAQLHYLFKNWVIKCWREQGSGQRGTEGREKMGQL